MNTFCADDRAGLSTCFEEEKGVFAKHAHFIAIVPEVLGFGVKKKATSRWLAASIGIKR
jgi:hypothetical protein